MSDLIKIQTISQVHDFFGLEKPKHPLVSVLRIIDKFRQMGLSKVHYSIDLYQVTFKSVNCADLRYGRNSYDYEDGTLIFVGSGQTDVKKVVDLNYIKCPSLNMFEDEAGYRVDKRLLSLWSFALSFSQCSIILRNRMRIFLSNRLH